MSSSPPHVKRIAAVVVSRETTWPRGSESMPMFHVNPLIPPLNVSRESLADAELREDHVEQVLDIDGSRQLADSVARQAQVLRLQFQQSLRRS
jgi:hypothetical protein